MARTSLKPVEIPEGISLESKDKTLVFSGKLGEMSMTVHDDVDIKEHDSSISSETNTQLEVHHIRPVSIGIGNNSKLLANIAGITPA